MCPALRGGSARSLLPNNISESRADCVRMTGSPLRQTKDDGVTLRIKAPSKAVLDNLHPEKSSAFFYFFYCPHHTFEIFV
jgi:hypothetical protein